LFLASNEGIQPESKQPVWQQTPLLRWFRRTTQKVESDNNGEPTMFSENDILAMHVLRGRPIVVLSACETAMGGHGSSELFDTADFGIMKLPKAPASSFLRVGARFVVGSLWLVIEDCATKFTAAFYEALASGEAPSKALGSAVRATRQYRSTVVSSRAIPADHPIYWAPFMAIRAS
jgi:CHAT domain-containing protein